MIVVSSFPNDVAISIRVRYINIYIYIDTLSITDANNIRYTNYIISTYNIISIAKVILTNTLAIIFVFSILSK